MGWFTGTAPRKLPFLLMSKLSLNLRGSRNNITLVANPSNPSSWTYSSNGFKLIRDPTDPVLYLLLAWSGVSPAYTPGGGRGFGAPSSLISSGGIISTETDRPKSTSSRYRYDWQVFRHYYCFQSRAVWPDYSQIHASFLPVSCKLLSSFVLLVASPNPFFVRR